MRARTYTKKDVVKITAERSGHTFSTTFPKAALKK